MRRLRATVGPLVLLLIVSGFFWKLLTKQYTWMDHPDMAYQVLPWYQFQAVSWQHGEFPLWDPHAWGGQTLIGQLLPGAAYPLNWLLFLLPLSSGRINQMWLHFYFIITHFFAAVFCYWLCRDLKRTRSGSILAGVVFALSGVVGSVGWPQMLNGAIWIPLIVLFLLRSCRGERPLTSAALSGTFLGIAFLSGHHQIPTFTCLMASSLWLFEISRRRLQASKPIAMFVLFTALVGALQILPAYEYGTRSIRWVGSQNPISWGQYVPYSVHQQYSLYPLGVLGLVLPNVTQQDTFVGLAALTLAIIGLALGFRYTEVRILGAICVGGLLFALGAFSVFHGVAYLLVPMVEKARSPGMAIVIVQFSIAVLTAYGLDSLRLITVSRWWILALATVGVLPWPALAVVSALRAETSLEYERWAVLAIVALALAAILHGWKSRHLSDRTAICLLFVVVIFELGTMTGANYPHRESAGGYLAELEKNSDVVDFLRKQPDLTRVEVDMKAVPYNIGDWEGIDQYQAYLGGITTNLTRLEVERLEGGRLAPMLFALNYYLGREPVRSGQQEVFVGKSGLKVFRYPNAFPRLWTVHEALPVKVPDLIPHLQAADLRRQVFLSQAAPALEKCSGEDAVRLLARGNARILVEAQMACKGMVIISETFFPGWEATIDGRGVRIYEAYGVLQGVVIDAGAHKIELRYRPMVVYCGAVLTVSGVLAVLLLLALAPRRL
jgi:Bacterial membrane protein YfhO